LPIRDFLNLSQIRQATSPDELLKRLQLGAQALSVQFSEEFEPEWRERAGKWGISYNPNTRVLSAPTWAIRSNFESPEAIKELWGGQRPGADRITRLARAVQAHELAEAFYLEQYGATHPRFSSHVARDVIRAEIGVAAQMGKQTLFDMLKFRQVELDYMQQSGRFNPSFSPPRFTTYKTDMLRIMQDVRNWAGKQSGTTFSQQQLAELNKNIISNFSDLPIHRYYTSMSKRRIGKIGLGMAAIAAGYYSLFSGSDDQSNVVQGMQEGGFASQLRKLETDFGSGYQGQEGPSSSTATNMAFGAVLGGAAGFGMSRMQAQAIIEEDLSAYPRLQELRKMGARGGFALYAPEFTEIQQIRKRMPWWSRLDPQMYNPIEAMKILKTPEELLRFKGVAYLHEPPNFSEEIWKQALRSKNILGMFEPEVGTNKLATYEWLSERLGGDQLASRIHPHTVGFDRLPIVPSAHRSTLLAEIKKLNQEWPLIIKHAEGSLQKDVYLNVANIPDEALDDMLKNPKDWVAQAKLDLADEFRVVTVGDKPVFTVHRWGTERMKPFTEFAKKIPGLGRVLEANRFPENLFGVRDEELRGRLETFASKVSKQLPYEVGAFDIGLTTEGQLKVIEAQRYFGTIRNPLVIERMTQTLTGGPSFYGRLARGMGAVGAGILVGAGMAALLSSDTNTAEITSDPKFILAENKNFDGFWEDGIAAQLRKANTPFGSGVNQFKVLRGLVRGALQQSKGAGQKIRQKIIERVVTPFKEGMRESMGAPATFEEALRRGKQVSVLGEGLYAESSLMRTVFQGQEYQYVRKRLLPDARKRVEEMIRNPRGRYEPGATDLMGRAEVPLETWRRYLRGLNLETEANVMRRIEDLNIAPKVYASSRREIFMEYIPHKTLGKAIMDGDDVTQGIMQIRKAMGRLSEEHKIWNLDPTEFNIMFDPKNKKAFWLDWGLAERYARYGFKAPQATTRMHQVFGTYLKRARGRVVSKSAATVVPSGGATVGAVPAARTQATVDLMGPTQRLEGATVRAMPVGENTAAREAAALAKTVRRAEAFRGHQAALWDAAHNGGQKHTTSYARRLAQARDPLGQMHDPLGVTKR